MAALLALAIAASGCSSSSSSSGGTASSGAATANATTTLRTIVSAGNDALSAAVAAKNVTAAGPLLDGPARQLLAGEFTVAAARHTQPVAATRLTAQTLLVPAPGGYPRWLAVAGTATGMPTPVLRVMRSPAASSPYAVWADLAVLPGMTVPEPAATNGQAPASLGPDAAGYAMSPGQLAQRYADVLNRGPKSAYASAFAADIFRTQLNARLAADRKRIMTTAVATIVSDHEPVAGGWGIRTAGGGALMVVQLTQTYTVTVDARGGVVTVDADLAALAGRSSFRSKLVRTSTEVLAFLVPSSGGSASGGAASGGAATVRLLAAVKGDVSATGS